MNHVSRLDCNQYKLDMDRVSQSGEDVYDTFNILMRRKPKENNFKAVLETIRYLMNTDSESRSLPFQRAQEECRLFYSDAN